ncbi:hypothetical protein [Arthrobacter sp. efr-133-R2A-63]|uniref:hypothetical protein n=1 Tax=Arthrobacter sp. efr-133-R2A-63 TaxID=3040278 RepID=UPI0025515B4E|nr:hypothetical protein [Arthrobacter sp. efr-133-R2A-63]
MENPFRPTAGTAPPDLIGCGRALDEFAYGLRIESGAPGLLILEVLPIGLVFAGLPAAVSDLLNEGVATFLRRANPIDLHAASIAEVERSFAETFTAAGVALDGELARVAAEGPGGYPFLIQLIGWD